MSLKIGLKRTVNVFFWIYILICIYIFKESADPFLISIYLFLISIFIGIIIKLVLNYIVDGFFD
jgi:hypothetical protein